MLSAMLKSMFIDSLRFASHRFLNESARWLLTRGRTDEAEAIMRQMAKRNNVEYPEDLIQRLETDISEDESTVMDLFSSPRVVATTLILCFNWSVFTLQTSQIILRKIPLQFPKITDSLIPLLYYFGHKRPF